MRDLAYEMNEALGEGDIERFATIMRRNWELKRSLTEGVSDAEIDSLHDRAMSAGATAGKLLGAGRGGFLLFVAPVERHAAIRLELSDLRETPFRFTASGSHVQLFEDSER
jgi:D-glycero-alpha-D-manno-heptose-7-phosphate kinase